MCCTSAAARSPTSRATHGTPLFVLDEGDFRGRAEEFATAFADADVHYASKAFLCGQVARWIADDGLHLDACSGNELALALAAGFPAERIALHGNNKSIPELQLAVDSGIGHDRARLLRRDRPARADRRRRGRGRCASGAGAHPRDGGHRGAHPRVHRHRARGPEVRLLAGHRRRARPRPRRVIRDPALHLAGLHSHIGSQIFDTAGFEAAAHRVVGLLGAVRQATGEVLAELNLGGGFGIAYLPDDDPISPADIAARLRTVVAAECAELDLPVPRLAVEPGRAIAGPGTVTLYEIGTIKPVRLGASGTPGTPHVRNYVSVDGGMSDNIRTALYDAAYTCVLANRVSDAPPALCRVVGKHCESGDILVRDLWLPADVQPGDLLAVAATGAYCWSMASNYNYLLKPPVVAVRDGRATEIVRRQTLPTSSPSTPCSPTSPPRHRRSTSRPPSTPEEFG